MAFNWPRFAACVMSGLGNLKRITSGGEIQLGKVLLIYNAQMLFLVNFFLRLFFPVLLCFLSRLIDEFLQRGGLES